MFDKDYAYRGTFTELGCAIGRNKTIIIVCPGKDDYYCQTNCFYHHPLINHVESVEEGFNLIKLLHKEDLTRNKDIYYYDMIFNTLITLYIISVLFIFYLYYVTI